MNNNFFLAYIPVLHQGYLQFFAKHPEVKKLLLLDASLLHNYRPIVKDLRALPAEQMKTILESLQLFETIEILTEANKEKIKRNSTIIAPDEDITRQVINTHFPEISVKYDSIFLRWDAVRTTQKKEVEPNVVISRDEFDRQMMQQAEEVASHSSDWWRQVGAVLAKDGKIIFEARNRHVPQDLQHYSDGDPRGNFSGGKMIELSTAIHAESQIIAEAANKGISVKGTNLYCTTFPCPVCAKLVAKAGISKLYYNEGYSLLDGESVLKAAGVEIIKVSFDS